MSVETDSKTWHQIDTWWDSFVNSQPIAVTDETTRVLDSRWFTDIGANLDPWFVAFSEAYSLPELDQETTTLDRRRQGRVTAGMTSRTGLPYSLRRIPLLHLTTRQLAYSRARTGTAGGNSTRGGISTTRSVPKLRKI